MPAGPDVDAALRQRLYRKRARAARIFEKPESRRLRNIFAAPKLGWYRVTAKYACIFAPRPYGMACLMGKVELFCHLVFPFGKKINDCE
jgi:hypothetical protein